MIIKSIPVETDVKCNKCGCEFIVDVSDVTYHDAFKYSAGEKYHNRPHSFSTKCPLCKKEITLKEK